MKDGYHVHVTLLDKYILEQIQESMYLPNNNHNQTNDQINKHKEIYPKKKEREKEISKQND